MIKLNDLILANDSWGDKTQLEIRQSNKDYKLIEVRDILSNDQYRNLKVKYFLGNIVLIAD